MLDDFPKRPDGGAIVAPFYIGNMNMHFAVLVMLIANGVTALAALTLDTEELNEDNGAPRVLLSRRGTPQRRRLSKWQPVMILQRTFVDGESTALHSH